MTHRKTLETIVQIKSRIKEIGEGYYHTNPLSSIHTPFGTTVDLDIFDWGMISALTELPLLLTGDTDRGKTDYMKILLTSLFGKDGYHKIDVDIDFGSNIFTTHDFSAIVEGKTSEELFSGKDWLYAPAICWDESNRAPAKLLNKLLHAIEKEITLENGQRLPIGYPTENGTYQFHIFAINEGEEFHGTNNIDRALRRRQTIEIPMDMFQTTMQDKREIIQKRYGRLEIHNGTEETDNIIQAMRHIKKLQVSPQAEHLMLYLQSMDACNKSITRSKRGINFSQQLCGDSNTSCHYISSYPKQMCPNIYNITEGLSINLLSIAKAHAFLRAEKVLEQVCDYMDQKNPKGFKAAKEIMKRKQFLESAAERVLKYNPQHGKRDETILREIVNHYIGNLKVEPKDIIASFPFVASGKIELNRGWIEKNYQGSRWLALKDIGDTAYHNVTEYHNLPADPFRRIVQGFELTEESKNEHDEAIKSDIWLQRSLSAYIEKPKRETRKKEMILELL
jgi:MoxR-like ATPase